MKKLTKLVLMILSVALAIPVTAQSTSEVVYLKNGSVIRGFIIEWIPNKTITLLTKDENKFVVNIQDIEKVVRSLDEKTVTSPVNVVQKVDAPNRNQQAPISENMGTVAAPRLPKVSTVPAYRNPGAALVWSIVIPGGGQIYNKQVGKGLLFMGGNVIGIAGMVIGIAVDELGVWIPGLSVYGATWLFSLIDAPISAKRINESYGLRVSLDRKNKTILSVNPTIISQPGIEGYSLTPGLSFRMDLH